MIRGFLLAAAILGISLDGSAQAPDWKAVEAEALKTLQAYVRINTSNPPGDVTKAADYLSGILKSEGVAVTRYESAPGRSILLARLKGDGTGGKPILLLSHMDVVPTDPSRWTKDPFGAEIADGKIWGRGTIDMKGIGTSYLYAFVTLHRLKVPLTRDLLLMFVPDEEVGGQLGAQWMRKNHYAELDPEYVIDEGGFGSRDMFTPGKLVFGISVAEKKIMWLRLRAEGVAGLADQPALGSRRSAASERHSVGGGSHARLPDPTGHVGGGVDQTPRGASRRFDDQDRNDIRGGGSHREPAGHAAVSCARIRNQASASVRDRHADDGAVRHRLERLPAARREELRDLSRHHPRRVDPLDARRCRVHAPRCDGAGDSDPLRGAEGDGVALTCQSHGRCGAHLHFTTQRA
jgi:hypothetical protein